jgi:hypothetical protein
MHHSQLARDLTAQNVVPVDADTTVLDGSEMVTLQPAGTIATHTLDLPAGQLNGAETTIFTTATITGLTVTSAGTSGVLGMPTTLAANASFVAKYSSVLGKWIRVG